MLTAGQRDGKLNIYDMRTSQTVKSSVIARGAINFLAVNSMTGHIVTGAADNCLKVLDLRGGSGADLKPVI